MTTGMCVCVWWEGRGKRINIKHPMSIQWIIIYYAKKELWLTIVFLCIWTKKISGFYLKKFGPNTIAKAIELILLFSMKEQNIQSTTCRWQHRESRTHIISITLARKELTKYSRVKKTIRKGTHDMLQKRYFFSSSTVFIN